ncbi:prepilin-type N-terminal cleavage/methylation domain-containing protein [Glaciihabitans sp. GrIS 2.15]|uniref:prepilin-type N-terminal cleavage/methylation domain-containing protein n=1 Tax=Glaciihabitans sp. GrIS 2.15 TaxID=3071710 RepID=UPI002DFCA62F|nr:type IV pilus assembly protein PilA [Glaciihabitans sp. GrIS 2.15]
MIIRMNKAMTAGREARKDGEKGFTLIELLVVIIIIGILAAIAIPVFLNQRQSAWKASVASDLKNAAVVVETYGTSNGGSFANFPGAGTAVVNSGGTTTGGVANGSLNFKVSTGNSITVTLVGTPVTSYTIAGSNSNISPGSQTFDSAAGGLGKFTP